MVPTLPISLIPRSDRGKEASPGRLQKASQSATAIFTRCRGKKKELRSPAGCLSTTNQPQKPPEPSSALAALLSPRQEHTNKSGILKNSRLARAIRNPLSDFPVEEHRQQVMKELIVTEHSYLKDMKTLLEVFLFPIKQENILEAEEIHSVFRNLETLISVNLTFYESLQGFFPAFEEDLDFPLGKCVLEMISLFKIYMEYCIEQPHSFEALETLQKKSRKFSGYLRVCSTDARCHGLFLNSFLIKPTQRICKYPLLLDDILKHTPEDHPDRQNLQQSLEEMKKILDHINERKRGKEAITRLVELNQKLENCPVVLLRPTRRLLIESRLGVYLRENEKQQMMTCLLFNDMIVFAKEKKNTLDCKLVIPFESCGMMSIGNSDRYMFTFEITDFTTNDSSKVVCSSEEEKNQWMTPIKEALKELHPSGEKEENSI